MLITPQRQVSGAPGGRPTGSMATIESTTPEKTDQNKIAALGELYQLV